MVHSVIRQYYNGDGLFICAGEACTSKQNTPQFFEKNHLFLHRV
jgi:hypothetical protein